MLELMWLSLFSKEATTCPLVLATIMGGTSITLLSEVQTFSVRSKAPWMMVVSSCVRSPPFPAWCHTTQHFSHCCHHARGLANIRPANFWQPKFACCRHPEHNLHLANCFSFLHWAHLLPMDWNQCLKLCTPKQCWVIVTKKIIQYLQPDMIH
jgi:hypothetical protein